MQISDASSFGLAIKQARVDSGLTQSALAQRCGTTQSWISELENGKPRAELELALRVIRELNLALEVSSTAPILKASRSALRRSDFDVADLVNMPRPPKSSDADDD